MMHAMDWDDVRVFHAVARARSLAAGARQAGQDRSTASRRIAALERTLGARLFLRTRDGLRLSPTGDRLLLHAERMAAEARSLEGAAAAAGAEVGGLVRIATTESLAAMLVREGLLALRERHPSLEIELLGGNRPVDLVRGEADMAVRVAAVKEPSLKVRRLARLSFALFAGKAYLERRARPRSESELAGHDVIIYGGELAALPEAKWLASRPGVRVALRTSSVTALLAAVIDGAGLGVVTGPWGERELGMVRLFDIDAIPPRPLWLAMHPDAASRAAVRVVAEHVTAIVQGGVARA
jgi:DNA-binding transcriptional LysR family regulator